MSALNDDDDVLPAEKLVPHVSRGDDMTLAGDAAIPVFDAGHEPMPFPPTDVQPMDDDGNILPGGDVPDDPTDDGFGDDIAIEDFPDDLPEPAEDLPGLLPPVDPM